MQSVTMGRTALIGACAGRVRIMGILGLALTRERCGHENYGYRKFARTVLNKNSLVILLCVSRHPARLAPSHRLGRDDHQLQLQDRCGITQEQIDT
jgi:hypothetical protein